MLGEHPIPYDDQLIARLFNPMEDIEASMDWGPKILAAEDGSPLIPVRGDYVDDFRWFMNLKEYVYATRHWQRERGVSETALRPNRSLINNGLEAFLVGFAPKGATPSTRFHEAFMSSVEDMRE